MELSYINVYHHHIISSFLVSCYIIFHTPILHADLPNSLPLLKSRGACEPADPPERFGELSDEWEAKEGLWDHGAMIGTP